MSSDETHTLSFTLEEAVQLRILLHSATEIKLIWKHTQVDAIRGTEMTTHVAAGYDCFQLATLELDFWLKVDLGEPQWMPYNFGYRYKVDPNDADVLVSDGIDLGRFGMAPSVKDRLAIFRPGPGGRCMDDYLALKREHGFYNIVFPCFEREITIAVPAKFR